MKCTPTVVLDGAHNPDGAAALEAEMRRLAPGRRIHLVFAVMRDKGEAHAKSRALKTSGVYRVSVRMTLGFERPL